MNKFTIFTIILAVSVTTIVIDLVVRDYFGSDGLGSGLETSVVSSNGDKAEDSFFAPSQESSQESSQDPSDQPSFSFPAPTPADPTDQSTADSESAPDPVQSGTQQTSGAASAINQSLIIQSGFEAILSEEHFDGKVFQLLDITKTPVENINFYQLEKNGSPIASITEITLRDEIRALQLYMLLQNKTKPYIDLSLNETNAYGDRSFYINHAKKQDEAFLTVKAGSKLYGFAYVKSYHPALRKLITLLNS